MGSAKDPCQTIFSNVPCFAQESVTLVPGKRRILSAGWNEDLTAVNGGYCQHCTVHWEVPTYISKEFLAVVEW